MWFSTAESKVTVSVDDKEKELKEKEIEAKKEEEQKAKGESEKAKLNKFKEIIEYSGMGEKDKLISLSVENSKIKAVIKLAPHNLLRPENIAVSMYS